MSGRRLRVEAAVQAELHEVFDVALNKLLAQVTTVYVLAGTYKNLPLVHQGVFQFGVGLPPKKKESYRKSAVIQ